MRHVSGELQLGVVEYTITITRKTIVCRVSNATNIRVNKASLTIVWYINLPFHSECAQFRFVCVLKASVPNPVTHITLAVSTQK